MYICICLFVCIDIYIYICIYICVYIYVPVCVSICYIHIYIFMYTWHLLPGMFFCLKLRLVNLWSRFFYVNIISYLWSHQGVTSYICNIIRIVTSYIWMSINYVNIIPINTSRSNSYIRNIIHVVTSYIWMSMYYVNIISINTSRSNITHMNESCISFSWIMSHISTMQSLASQDPWHAHICRSHVANMNTSCYSYDWATSHI